MNKRDYYDVLGVTRNSSDDEIKKSYRKLAMKFHPDRVSHLSEPEKKKSEENFKEIQEAYAVLSDPQKKQMYEQFGHAGVSGNSASSGASGFGEAGAGGFEDLFETFGDIFGGDRGRGRGNSANSRTGNMRGQDMETQIAITLFESSTGCEKPLQFQRTEKCSTCNGSGAKNSADTVTCKTCEGKGQVRFAQGFFSVQQTCPDCRGNGKIIKNPCSNCRGNGLVQQTRSITVNIPAGIDDGSTLRINGEGQAGLNGGQNGDLYVHIQIKPHQFFTRKAKDLHCEIPIDFITATLGGEVNVPIINGNTVSLTIPEGTQTNSILRVRDKGIKSLRGLGHGDLYCHIVVETPVKLTTSQKNILREFAKDINTDSTHKHQPKTNSFLDKLKDIFMNE